MPTKKKDKPKEEKATIEDGSQYMMVASWGTYYVPLQVTADTLLKALFNRYLREPINRLQYQVFGDDLTIEVFRPDGEPDEDAADRIMEMCEQVDVNLWAMLRVVWKGGIEWGCNPLNPVWKWTDGPNGREYWLDKLRYLPPESFAQRPPGAYRVFGEILQGIVLNDQGEVECWQSADGLVPKKLNDVTLFKHQGDTAIAGTSSVAPLVPLIGMMDFSWEAQMQQVNRIGAPSIFIKINPPYGKDDIEYAQNLLANWGKNNAFILRANMEQVAIEVKSGDVALTTIDVLKGSFQSYFNPAQPLQKEGNTIGGNAASEKQLYDAFIKSHRFDVEDFAESNIVQVYLDANHYEGYTSRVHIGSTVSGVGDLELKQAQVGHQTNSLRINEIRAKLGERALSDDELAQLIEERKKLPQQQQGPFGAAASLAEHVPTKEETELEKELRRAVEDLAGATYGALGG